MRGRRAAGTFGFTPVRARGCGLEVWASHCALVTSAPGTEGVWHQSHGATLSRHAPCTLRGSRSVGMAYRTKLREPVPYCAAPLPGLRRVRECLAEAVLVLARTDKGRDALWEVGAPEALRKG